MTLAELEKRLDEIAWNEQLEHEISERPSVASPPDLEQIDARLRALAALLDSRLLDALERADGYLAWTLRLARFVDPDRGVARSRRYLEHANWSVRHWARVAQDAS